MFESKKTQNNDGDLKKDFYLAPDFNCRFILTFRCYE